MARYPSAMASDAAADREVFARLLAETDASIARVDAFLADNGLLGVDAPCRGTSEREVDGRVALDVFATSVLPHDWEFAGRGVWEFYKSAQKHSGPVFGKTAQRVGPREDAVLESFVMEISAADARADFHIRQCVKRFDQRRRQVIAWTIDSRPAERSGAAANFGFHESGFVVCRPPHSADPGGEGGGQGETDTSPLALPSPPPPPVTIMQLVYRISPYITTGSRGQRRSLRADMDSIAQFMFASLNAEVRARLERIENLLLDERRAH